jgi:hypothetical protein
MRLGSEDSLPFSLFPFPSPLTELLRLALRMEEYGDGSSFGDVAAGDRVGMAFDAATGSSAG